MDRLAVQIGPYEIRVRFGLCTSRVGEIVICRMCCVYALGELCQSRMGRAWKRLRLGLREAYEGRLESAWFEDEWVCYA